jgi:hypothetical protein
MYNEPQTIKTNNLERYLPEDPPESLKDLISEFQSLFTTGTACSTVTTSELKIRLTTDVPIRYRPYRLSYAERQTIREIIDDLCQKGIVRPSCSPYASPILLVTKKDGSPRMCVDYSALNRITVKNRYPLPRIEDQIDHLQGHTLFSSLDMASGFHQIPFEKDSIEKTAFVTPDTQMEYLKMPFGLANAPSVYQKAINQALHPLLTSGKALVYLDDVLIPFTTVDENLELLRQAFQLLQTSGFQINAKKCKFLQTEIEYLGRLISL